MNILKVFADKKDAGDVKALARVIEAYDAFLLVETDDEQTGALSDRFPVEDITQQYYLGLQRRATPTLATAAQRVANATRSAEKLPRGPHHYVVQFVGPIKPGWLTQVRATGASLRVPHEGFSYVVRATQGQLAAIADLPFVRWTGHLPHADRIGCWPAPAGSKASRVVSRQRERPGVLTVEIFDKADTARIAMSARKLGFRVLAKEPAATLLVVETSMPARARRKQINELSAVHGVRFIRQRMLPRIANDVAVSLSRSPPCSCRSARRLRRREAFSTSRRRLLRQTFMAG